MSRELRNLETKSRQGGKGRGLMGGGTTVMRAVVNYALSSKPSGVATLRLSRAKRYLDQRAQGAGGYRGTWKEPRLHVYPKR